MLTEAEWVAALDAAPGDATLRLVYADWLDDRGGCGDGWRALGVTGLTPYHNQRDWPFGNAAPEGGRRQDANCYEWWLEGRRGTIADAHKLPADWLDLLVGDAEYRNGAGELRSVDFYVRHAAESAAADAFLLLPAARRAELLGVPV